MKIHLNGALVDVKDARIDTWDRGLTLGDGVFETIRVRRGVAQRLPAHLARLREGAGVLGVPVAANDADLGHALAAVVKANDVADGFARLTLTRGPAARGVAPPEQPSPTVLIAAQETGAPDAALVRAIIAASTCRNEHSPLSRIKSLNYLDNVIARNEAVAAGADDALLLNTRGTICAATSANLFVTAEGQILTPPVSDGALPGVMRADVIAAVGATEQTLAPHAFRQISEAFLTNSLGIRPLVEVNGEKIGRGEPGPVCRKLQALM